MLKTLFVKTKDRKSSISVIEDNCSTDSFITFEKAEELGLEGTNVTLEIEGINTTERIDSKVYQVPVRDKGGKIHFIECYGLSEITKSSPLPNPEVYEKICKSLQVDSSTVKRPSNIDLLLSAKHNNLMSDNVVKERNGLKLYCGPLGQTISGNSSQFVNEHIKAYPSKAKLLTPITSTVDELPISPFQARIYKLHAQLTTVKLAKVHVKLDGSNDVENSSNCVSESPTGGVTQTIKAEAGSTTLPTSSPPGDEAVVECRYPDLLLPASITPPRPPGGGEAKAKVTNIPIAEAVPDKKPPQMKEINFQNFSKLNLDPAQPSLKFAPMFSTFPCSRPKNQSKSNAPVSDFKEKGTIRKKEIAKNVQQSNTNKVIESNPNKVEEEVIPSNPEADDNATAIGGVCSLDSKDDRDTSGTRARQNCSPPSGQFEQPTSQPRDEI